MNSNKIQKYSKIIIASVTGLIFIATPLLAGAQYKIESIDVANTLYKDFVVGPGKIEIEIKPGETKTALMTVSNRMGDTRMFSLGVEDFTGSRDPQETVVLLGDERGPYSLKDYLKFETKDFVLQNGQRALIPVTISLPTDAQPGGLYGSVLVSTTATPAEGAQRSAIVSRLGVLFFIKVPGAVKEVGELKGFSTVNDQKIFGQGPIEMRLLYENNGSVYVNPYGEVRIKNILGEEVGAVEVDPWFSLPQSLRVREVTWDRQFLFGRYTAVASINRGYGDVVDTKVLTFWVIPWKIVVAGFGGLFVLIFLIRFVVTRFEFKRKTK